MIFPEIRQALKRWWPDAEPIRLNLKTQNLTFDTVNIPNAQWLFDNGYFGTLAALGAGMPAWSGESVNLQTALSHSVVFACNKVISEAVGALPAVLMQDVKGEKRVADEHPMYRAMKLAPSSDMTAQAFREMLTSHCLLQGNGFAKILRRSGTGTAIGLEPLLPQQVRTGRETTGQKRLFYEVTNASGAVEKTYFVTPGQPADILHLRGLGNDGIRGYSVIELGRNSIGSALAAEKNLAKFWSSGGRPPYHLEHPTKFRSDEDFARFRRDWDAVYSDPHKAPITENGMKYIVDGVNLRDSQSVENRQHTVSEICRWFNLSPHLAQDLSHATFSNIEHLALEFVKHTLGPWLVRWESEFYRCVLTPEEKNQNYYLKHNVNALLRGDFVTRMTGYSTALQNGFFNIDNVLALEDMNPLDNGAGQAHHIQLNMQTIPGTGTPTVAEQRMLNTATTSKTSK